MLTSKPTPEIISQWQAVFKEYKCRLAPNRKSTNQVVDFSQRNIQSRNWIRPWPWRWSPATLP